ncbi:MAG: radical SAM protein [Myxococcales bacterium]|nr:radical SAM protein [Myxococcales bacterium]
MPRLLSDRARLIASYLRGATTNIPGPSALMIETTVRCNLLCPMCPRTGAGYPNADLPDDLLWPLLEDHARLGGDHVYLYGLGEPLMDARIWRILARARELKLGTVLSSNGTLLTPKRRAELLDNAPDHLLVGIDGASAETYEYYRKGGDYEKVVRNVRALAAEKAARKSPMTLVVQFIEMAKNRHETAAFMKAWRGLPGVDDVRVKDEDIGLPEHRTYGLSGERRDAPCHFLWRGAMLVRYTGDVYPCYHFGSVSEPIGNLRNESLEALWNGPALQRLRALHVARRAGDDPACATCPAPRPKMATVAAAMSLRGTTVRKLVPIAEHLGRLVPGLFTERREAATEP